MAVERQKHNKIGESGFFHFYGVVEGRNDEKRFGRVQVRIYGDHTKDLVELPTEQLQWAQVMLPVTAPPNTSHNLWDGTLVFGYYADGIEKQVPIITGQLAKDGETTLDPAGKKTEGFLDQRVKKDCSVDDGELDASVGINTSPVANPDKYSSSHQYKLRNKQILSVGKYTELGAQYASVYPFNRAEETESGHLIEKDDTPGNERIAITHRSGAYVEMLKDGTVLYKAAKDKHDVVSGDNNTAVKGSYSRNVGGSVDDNVLGGYTLKISGGNLDINVSGSVNITSGGAFNVNSSTINMKASTINLN